MPFRKLQDVRTYTTHATLVVSLVEIAACESYMERWNERSEHMGPASVRLPWASLAKSDGTHSGASVRMY